MDLFNIWDILPDKWGHSSLKVWQFTILIFLSENFNKSWHFMWIFYQEKTSLDISCESSAWQSIHMKLQDYKTCFSLKIKKKKEQIKIL